MGSFMLWLDQRYVNARQQHLGEFLDYLADLGSLTWELRREDHKVVWLISEGGRASQGFSLGEAERVAEVIADSVMIFWLPLGSAGGRQAYLDLRARIADRRRRLEQEPLTHGADQVELPLF